MDKLSLVFAIALKAMAAGPGDLTDRLFSNKIDQGKFRQVDARGIAAAKVHNG